MSAENNNVREQILANSRLLLTTTSTTQAKIEVVVFGQGGSFTGAVMLGHTPAIEGAEAMTPDLATRKLLLATCELLNTFIPKLGDHQRTIHGGGIFDEDLISPELFEALRKNT